jgi:murein DD-endopeptidase MepM/ murein hydrolase activator NlpD
MRVTSPPAALSVAAALAVLALLAHPSSAGAVRWQRPVPGEVTRSFDYSPAAPFARGAHRGADLGAPPGRTVRAACDGRVVHAGPVPGGAAAVTLACGSRRVTHLPLRSSAVERGVRVRAGARLGALAAGHGGLHLGVRDAGDPFAYQDPLPLLPPAPRARPEPPIAAPVRPATPPRIARPAARPARPVAPAPAGAPFAPPLAWAGLALASLGAAGTGAIARTRRRRRRTERIAAPAVRAQSNA